VALVAALATPHSPTYLKNILATLSLQVTNGYAVDLLFILSDAVCALPERPGFLEALYNFTVVKKELE
jgi:hypothetical protein